MIKRIFPNELDHFNMSLKRTQPVSPSQKVDYKGLVVNKPWGYEYLLFENSHVAIWVLFLKHEAKTSTHCHPKKKTSLLVLDGEVRTSSLDSVLELKSLEGVIIESGVFHSTGAVSEEGVFLMEVETPVDKSDLVRLKDAYGRENLGYESSESITDEVHKYEHHHFHEKISEEEEVERILKKKSLKIHHSKGLDQLRAKLEKSKHKILCPLNYKLLTKEGDVFLEVGDIIEIHDLEKATGITSIPDKGLYSLIIS